ncbi:MAG: hypothetical protein H8E31_08360 [Planctomycetes bacterium]|nr:hypothetical protein [Planctomycetota bacterium]
MVRRALFQDVAGELTDRQHAGTTDAAGSASFTSAPIPSGAAGLTVYLEAAAAKAGFWYDSNPLTLVIQ